VDPRLSQLLPARLQRLVLADVSNMVPCLVVSSNTLAHLTALLELDLIKVGVAGQGPGTLAQDLPALQQLQQLRVQEPRMAFSPGHDPLQLAPLVTFYKSSRWSKPEWINPLVHLTALDFYSPNDAPEGLATTLAALSRLQALRLDVYMDTNAVACVQQAASMSGLRRLELDLCARRNTALSAAVAGCTQVTSLTLMVAYLRDGPFQILGDNYSIDERLLVAALQQLTRLRSLKVHAPLLELAAGAWLAPLTALSSLHVGWLHKVQAPAAAPLLAELAGTAAEQPEWNGHHTIAQLLLDGVQAWPPALQQVLFTPSPAFGEPRRKPSSWVHTPPTPGAAPLTVWLEQDFGQVAGWPRPWQPCPHLPGVWELSSDGQQNV
jgi:hypothetical protein